MQSIKQFYLIKIEGHINFDWSTLFEEVTIKYTNNGQTVLRGQLPDQTALHGILTRIRDLGLILVELKCINNPNNSK